VVISIAMLAAGSDPAGYYLDRQAGCAADYYTGAGERAGVWLGSGAAAVGLAGQLDTAGEQILRGLLDGRAPDGRVLVPPVLRADPRGRLPAAPLVQALRARAADRGVAVEAMFIEPADRAAYKVLAADQPRGLRTPTVDAARAGRLAAAAGVDPHAVYRGKGGADRYAAALAHAGGRVDVRRAGIDVTISAPKSVSILYGLGPPEVAAAVQAAHRVAVGEALNYLESRAGHALRGHQGDGQRASRIGTQGWIVAAFEHRASRAGDPQLHTHLVVPNLLRGADGRWSALDSRAVHRHALTASYLYHAVLRGQLSARLGLAWTTPEKGVAEIAGIPDQLIKTFSQRRRQILGMLDATGRRGPAAAQAACLATRPAKDTTTELTLRDRWTARARAAGHDPAKVVAAVLRRSRPPRPPGLDRLAQELLGPAGLTAHATGFDRRDLLQALCQTIPAGLPVDRARLEAAADVVLRHDDAVRLATRTADGPRWSTAELLTVEQHALALADQLRQTPAYAVDADAVAPALAARKLSLEQQRMVRALTNPSGLAVVVGPAGAGKTSALSAATHAWTTAGRPVAGAALAAVTARRLEHATGIPSTTLARLLTDATTVDPATGRPAGLPRGGVLVIDEASMVDTRTLAALLAHTQAAAGTLVLVGDPAQLPEIRAGGLFAALTRHPDTIHLTANRRQIEAWECHALAHLRAGAPKAAVAAYAAHDRIHTAPPDKLPERIVTDYLRHRDQAEHPEQVVMLALRRADVALLNQLTRAHLLAGGRLGDTPIIVGHCDSQRDYRAGDQVVVTANDHRRGLVNGTRATITNVDARGHQLTLTTHQQQLTVPAGWAAGRLDHGYALTCHKAQGTTVDTALLYGAGTLAREAGYVGLSRGRRANHLYIAADPQPVGLDENAHLRQLSVELAASRAHTMATRQLPRRAGLRPLDHPTQAHQIEGISL
jgi:conjugative relaxase-like TrwC/TraI family protein